MNRYFRALRTITLPQDLIAGPGATNMRLDPGAIVTCDADACIRQGRFVNSRIREHDIEELDEKSALAALATAPEPKTVENANERKADSKLGMTVAEPKKER
jgi:hypothetical protein